MTKSERQKLESKKREWNLALRGPERIVKLEIRHMIDWMMYYKKPQDRFERGWHTMEWWGVIILIFFALRGIFGGW